MPANNSGIHVGWLAGQFPGRVGHLISPGGWRRPHRFFPYALDNGRFVATTQNREWDEKEFLKLRDKAKEAEIQPRWVVVPDVVGNRDGTLREWDHWHPRMEEFGWKLAMAVQDGMTPDDVPSDVVCFVGGSTEWKWANLERFCAECDHVHVGRVNSEKRLWQCHRAGAASCDGTGWYRGDKKQLAGLVRFLALSSAGLEEDVQNQ